MESNNSKDLKLKRANEFQALTTFREKYAFYENYKKELGYEDPQDPLMVEFYKCNEELQKLDEGKMPKRNEAVYRTDLQETHHITKRKLEIIELLKKQNEALGIYKPEPSNNEEGGQMIEYWVKVFEEKPKFEERKANILAMIKGQFNKSIIIKTELAKTDKELEEFKAATILLDRAIKENYEINFPLLYKMANEEKGKYCPLAINYKKLTSAIPLVQLKCFLEKQLDMRAGVQIPPDKLQQTNTSSNDTDTNLELDSRIFV